MSTSKQRAPLQLAKHFLLGFTALAFSSLGSMSFAASYAGEIVEWLDHRDGSSTIVVLCQPGARELRVRGVDNKKLKRMSVRKLIEQLDARCTESEFR